MSAEEVFLKAFAALVAATFATFLVVGRPRSPHTLFLAGFLLLISGNQGAEALRASAVEPAARVLWLRVAGVFSALDPAVLSYFASIFPARSRLNRPLVVSIVWVPAGILALLFAAIPAATEDAPGIVLATTLTAIYTTAVYSGVLAAAVVRGTVREDRRHALFVLAMGLAAVPLWMRFLPMVQIGIQLAVNLPLFVRPWLQLGEVVILASGILLLIFIAAQGGPNRRWGLAEALAASIGLTLIISFRSIGEAWGLVYSENSTVAMLGRVGAAVRWLSFAAIMSVAVLRYEEVSISAATRRASARVMIALSIAGIVAGLFLLFPGTIGLFGLDSAPLLVVGVGVAIAVSQGFRSLVDRVAASVYGILPPASIEARHAAYRAAIVSALGSGAELTESPHLAWLRRELGIDDTVARALETSMELTTPTSLSPGRLISRRYHVTGLIGRGGHGPVFLARDVLLERQVAIKEVPVGADPSTPALVNEARSASAVQHENVVTLYDVLLRPGAVLLVMEYASGGSLHARAMSHKLNAAETSRVIRGMIRGLAVLHRAGVVHGDIKPANVLFGAGDVTKICDFGISVLRTGETLDATSDLGSLRGTPGFAAPEQLDGGTPTKRADVYSAGCLIREFAAAAGMNELFPVIARATASSPLARYADAMELEEAFEMVIAP